MNFYLFEPSVAKHLRKSLEYLEGAKLKRVRHQAAAERHGALTQLYAERISRIKSEISEALQARSTSHQPRLTAESENVLPKPDSVPVYSPRALHA
jgi:hypothetical protein